MYRIPLSAFGIAIPGFHVDFSFGGCPLFLSVSQSTRVQTYPPKWVTVSNSPCSPVKRVQICQLYINLDLQGRMSHDFPMIFPWFPMVYWEFISARDVTRGSYTTVTSARILLASCLSWMAWLWTNFHMHNFCVCFGRLAPAKKHLRRSFFGAKKKKNCISAPE